MLLLSAAGCCSAGEKCGFCPLSPPILIERQVQAGLKEGCEWRVIWVCNTGRERVGKGAPARGCGYRSLPTLHVCCNAGVVRPTRPPAMWKASGDTPEPPVWDFAPSPCWRAPGRLGNPPVRRTCCRAPLCCNARVVGRPACRAHAMRPYSLRWLIGVAICPAVGTKGGNLVIRSPKAIYCESGPLPTFHVCCNAGVVRPTRPPAM